MSHSATSTAAGRPRMPGRPPDAYLTPVSAAVSLDVSTATVIRWCVNGSLRAHRVGGRWRIAPADLARFLRGNSPPA